MADVLVVDDNETIRDGLALLVRKWGHRVSVAASGREALGLFRRAPADVVLTDLKMDELDGVGLLRELRRLDPDVPVLLMTAYGTVDVAVEAMKIGAFDFLTKPLTPEVVQLRLTAAIELALARQAAKRAAAEIDCLRQDARSSQLIGDSEVMAAVRTAIAKVAPTDTTVFIGGESGTGKELIAAEIHARSRRANGPFIKVNCAAMSDTLLESELFGHEKGAFTGAVRQKLGRFELAHGGTLFLDEIGDISAAMQAKLLRAIQERTIERVGGERSIQLDVRILSATHKSLEQEVARGAFRQDLFYRLHVFPIMVPPLRERGHDVITIARAMVSTLAQKVRGQPMQLTAAAEAQLLSHTWPGNVRELINCLEQAVVLADSATTLDATDLPGTVSPARALPNPTGDRSLPDLLEDVERQLITAALQKAHGVKAEAARLLGIKAPALYYKLEKYGLL